MSSSGATISKTSCPAWLAGATRTHGNATRRSHRWGPFRWKIEHHLWKGQHHGYRYEQCCSYHGSTMQGFP